MPENFRKLRRPRTLLEGLILRSAHAEDVRQTWHARARVSKDEEGCALMLRDGGCAASSA